MQPLGHLLPSFRYLRQGRHPTLVGIWALSLSLLITSCATPPIDAEIEAVSAVAPGSPPAPLEGEQLDLTTIAQLSNIARDQSLLLARHYRNQAVATGIDASTLRAMDSRLAWYSGDIDTAATLLDALGTDNTASLAFVRGEREYRAAASGDWLAAARAVYQQAKTHGPSGNHEDLGERLFQYLLRLPDTTVNEQLKASKGDPVWRAWLEMQKAYRADQTRFSEWLDRNTGRMSHPPLPRHLLAWAESRDLERLAIILPLDGSLAAAGEAVLAGAVEQLYAQYPNPAKRPKLTTINSGQYESASAAYQRAARDDPDLIMGPLTKNEVANLINFGPLPIPTILLNQIDEDPEAKQKNRLNFSLAPEDEAHQIADIAFGRGCRNAMVIAAAGDRGTRLLRAFAPRWTQIGGKIRDSLVIVQASDANKALGELLGSGSSDDRIRAIETAFDLPVDARGRGRSDFECIFMLAPDPTTARAWRPLLVFHMSGDTPVYATSAINDGVRDSRNGDLNGVLFVEIPAMLPPHVSDRLSRLRALGRDALALAQHWHQATVTDDWIIRGDTGILRRKHNGLIERASELATFDGAEPRYSALP